MNHLLSCIFGFLLTIICIQTIHCLTQQSKRILVQVCQNKDCCQRYQGKAQNLVQTMKTLCPPTIEVESSGCLSQCGKGPNVCIQTNEKEEFYGDIVDAASAGAVLEMATDINIHPTLVAAANVMERASKAPSLEEEMRFLTSVIAALDKKDELKDSFAMSQARAMRASANLRSSDYKEAIHDAKCAVELDPSNDKAWRTLADAHEAAGNIQGAVEALKLWSKMRPTFSTKANKEIQRLKEL